MQLDTLTFPKTDVLSIANDAVERAGVFLMSHFRSTGESGFAGKQIIESEMKAKAEEIIRYSLSDASEYDFSGEYSSSHLAENKHVWLVDALNGVTNYSRQIPHFATSIALIENRIPVFGLIRNHSTGEVITAIRERGAWSNNTRLVVSNKNLLSNSLTAMHTTAKERVWNKQFNSLCDKILEVSEVRITGSPALDLCSLASGSFEIFCGRGVKMNEIAAGLLIAREAGAVFSFSSNRDKSLNILGVSHRLEQELMTSLPELTIFSDDLPGFACKS